MEQTLLILHMCAVTTQISFKTAYHNSPISQIFLFHVFGILLQDLSLAMGISPNRCRQSRKRDH